ncbi:M48 family metalloprotease [Streptomyces sp. H10-C2]|uniref:M48 family metalloprotease n=1 Tax=unclassified Streptomyces TaxID=2593676 RepID=UPI0024BB8E28|nr:MULTISPECIES: M48 family metalloprotease [unclassified Streptomyces]MDJ0341753.1 M48 family metalloprotease [Streptomyces sp. PH10-H1]MDJ0368939.1 M48 family metalloprotease [Streptomyces sp. H10-C2]
MTSSSCASSWARTCPATSEGAPLMHLLVYLPLVLPILAALAAGPVADRLEPRLATWLLAACALCLAACSCAALGVLAVAGMIRIPAAVLVGHWPLATIRSGDPVSGAEAALAALLLAAAAYAAARLLGRRVRAVVAAGLEAACLPGPGPLAVIDDPVPDAYALPGLPGRIVVSTGMLQALGPAEREAMVAHERAHLAAHHYAFAAAVHLAAAANPFLRPFATAVAYTVERWADENAARACGDRRQIARAVGKAALATRKTPARRRAPAAAFGLLGWRRDPLAGAGPVPRRVAALLAPPLPRGLLLPPLDGSLIPLAATACAVGASALCTFAAAHDLHLLLKIAGA